MLLRPGFTIDRISQWRKQKSVMQKFVPFKPLYRFVCDDTEEPQDYDGYIEELSSFGDVVLCVVDSYYVEKFDTNEYVDRFRRYHEAFAPHVFRWEIGNEVGGGSKDPLHLQKAIAASQLMTSLGAKQMLNGYLQEGWFDFLGKIPFAIRDQISTMTLSVYPEDNGGMRDVDWEKLGDLFTNAELGVGECGYPRGGAVALNRFEKFYNDDAANIKHPRFFGGFFWWYFWRDFVDAKFQLTDHAIQIIAGWNPKPQAPQGFGVLGSGKLS